MPAQQRRRLHDEQRLVPCPGEPGGRHHPPSIGGGELGACDLAVQHEQLLSEQGVLCDELRTSAESIAHDRRDLAKGVTGDQHSEQPE